MSLKRRFSCFSRLAHVFRFSSFFLGDALWLPFPPPFPLSPTGKLAFPRPRGRGSPQLDFLHFAYFLLRSLPLHLRVSAVARILPSDLSSRATAATLRSHFFFRHGGFLRPMRVDFFLIRTHIRVRPPCIKVSSRSSGFFYHDNVPGYFRVYLSAPSSFPPCFIANIFPYSGSPRDNSLRITYSRIISHVISRVSSSDASFSSLSLSLPSFLASKVRSLFLRSTRHSFRALDIRSIYFFSGFFNPLSRLFSSRLLLPHRAQLLAPHMTAVRNSITDSSCDLKPARLGPRSDK